jgi:hypothetical protein
MCTFCIKERKVGENKKIIGDKLPINHNHALHQERKGEAVLPVRNNKFGHREAPYMPSKRRKRIPSVDA